MYLSNLALLLATFFCTIALVYATPQGTATPSSLPPVSQPTNATNPYDPRVCIKNRRPFSQRYLLAGQCRTAISRLPTGDTVGLFHDHGEPDIYLLPQTRKVGTCEVTVTVSYGYDREYATWDDLQLQAQYLVEKCCALNLSDDLAPNDNSLLALEGKNNKGAYTPAGQAGKIKIELTYVSSMSEAPVTLSIGGNATNLTSDAVLGETTAISKAASGTNITPDVVAAA